MGRFSLWRLRVGKLQWFIFTIFIFIIYRVIEEWVFSDIVQYIRTHWGLDMNIVELAQRTPFTIVAIVALILIGVWILKKGNRDSALQDLYKLLLDIRDSEKSLVTRVLPDILAQHHREFRQEVDFLVLQSLQNLKAKHKGKKKGKTDDITAEELTNMRIERLVPYNAELESLKDRDKKLGRLWKNVRLLQTALMDDILDKRIAWFERMLKLNSAYKIYKEVMTRLFVVSMDDYGTITKAVKGTEDSLADAHSAVNRRLIELVSDKERSKAQSWAKQETR